jgi:hypothetical protein
MHSTAVQLLRENPQKQHPPVWVAQAPCSRKFGTRKGQKQKELETT